VKIFIWTFLFLSTEANPVSSIASVNSNQATCIFDPYSGKWLFLKDAYTIGSVNNQVLIDPINYS
jgi:hypothetical protein